MKPETQREHFRGLLRSISTSLRLGQNAVALSHVKRALETFDETYADDRQKIVQISTNNDELTALLSSGELWSYHQQKWIEVPLPPPYISQNPKEK